MNKLPLQLFIPTHKAELLYEYHRGCALCVGIKICVWGLLNYMCSYIKSASDITPKDKICWIGRQFPPCRCRFCQTNCVSFLLALCLIFAAVSLRGTVIIIANHGDRIDIPAGAILENKIVSGNLRILDHWVCSIGSVSYTHLTLPTILRCRSRWSPYH